MYIGRFRVVVISGDSVMFMLMFKKFYKYHCLNYLSIFLDYLFYKEDSPIDVFPHIVVCIRVIFNEQHYVLMLFYVFDFK